MLSGPEITLYQTAKSWTRPIESICRQQIKCDSNVCGFFNTVENIVEKGKNKKKPKKKRLAFFPFLIMFLKAFCLEVLMM